MNWDADRYYTTMILWSNLPLMMDVLYFSNDLLRDMMSTCLAGGDIKKAQMAVRSLC